jgi:hypothetical protein
MPYSIGQNEWNRLKEVVSKWLFYANTSYATVYRKVLKKMKEIEEGG